MTNSVSYWQNQILEITRNSNANSPIGKEIETAFLETPRHLFIRRYKLLKKEKWHEVNESNLEEHLPILYRNYSLDLWREDGDKRVSTISQPSLVLYMLNLLKLEPGHKVLELGAGSGWNAALMGHIVGAEGHVYSMEIIPEVAKIATENIDRFGVNNVSIIEGDAGDGYETESPFDRIIFTAGTFDLPRNLYHQIKEGGLLLVVIKNEGGGDNLFLLQKKDEYFESLDSSPCGFVYMTGKYSLDRFDPIYLEDLPEWNELQTQEISRTSFWWGYKDVDIIWRTMPIRFFLSISEPLFQTFKSAKTDSKNKNFFGIWDRENKSLAIAKDNQIITYGNSHARERLSKDIHSWVDLGMPGATCFKLQIYPIDLPINVKGDRWIVKRQESQFVWQLDLSTG
ncbi:MAG: methyltransferase domain-containing protein [Xenococcaceae cyanobacterium MO_188.B29]|nr:methyltransferase domain-containing protein [Xenococcaceae cyanobacterium MO_188.B29]